MPATAFPSRSSLLCSQVSPRAVRGARAVTVHSAPNVRPGFSFSGGAAAPGYSLVTGSILSKYWDNPFALLGSLTVSLLRCDLLMTPLPHRLSLAPRRLRPPCLTYPPIPSSTPAHPVNPRPVHSDRPQQLRPARHVQQKQLHHTDPAGQQGGSRPDLPRAPKALGQQRGQRKQVQRGAAVGGARQGRWLTT